MTVLGEAVFTEFAAKHAPSRNALKRFLKLVRMNTWPHFAALKQTLPATDYVNGKLIFNIGGNKYRLVASIDFDEQTLYVEQVLTHVEYSTRRF